MIKVTEPEEVLCRGESVYVYELVKLFKSAGIMLAMPENKEISDRYFEYEKIELFSKYFLALWD